ncbi:hypothetical protein, partial [Vibrio sp. V05_P4A8T149]|uniref:hypothetical protein n=1 Tax=Vibrio sp. V05_P4A8T149 TaxID=1938660 RepID=UPI0020CD308C
MSDTPTTVEYTVETLKPVVESSGSIWGYVAGGVVLAVVLGYFAFKKLNKPAFVIKQMRKRNRKEMKKHGVERAEAMVDLELLLDALQEYACQQARNGSTTVPLVAPLKV